MASGSGAYYSFDYGAVHFVCLDSYLSKNTPNSPMLSWLQADLASLASRKPQWLIAIWHHPPYTKGTVDSDSETECVKMRENVLPLLEAAGVDLVVGGHSHNYERSKFLNGHYGKSSSFSNAMVVPYGTGTLADPHLKLRGLTPNGGMVSVVAGSSGMVDPAAAGLMHPANVRFGSRAGLLRAGSLILDVSGYDLTCTFVTDSGSVGDQFRIRKSSALPLIGSRSPSRTIDGSKSATHTVSRTLSRSFAPSRSVSATASGSALSPQRPTSLGSSSAPPSKTARPSSSPSRSPTAPPIAVSVTPSQSQSLVPNASASASESPPPIQLSRTRTRTRTRDPVPSPSSSPSVSTDTFLLRAQKSTAFPDGAVYGLVAGSLLFGVVLLTLMWRRLKRFRPSNNSLSPRASPVARVHGAVIVTASGSFPSSSTLDAENVAGMQRNHSRRQLQNLEEAAVRSVPAKALTGKTPAVSGSCTQALPEGVHRDARKWGSHGDSSSNLLAHGPESSPDSTHWHSAAGSGWRARAERVNLDSGVLRPDVRLPARTSKASRFRNSRHAGQHRRRHQRRAVSSSGSSSASDSSESDGMDGLAAAWAQLSHMARQSASAPTGQIPSQAVAPQLEAVAATMPETSHMAYFPQAQAPPYAYQPSQVPLLPKKELHIYHTLAPIQRPLAHAACQTPVQPSLYGSAHYSASGVGPLLDSLASAVPQIAPGGAAASGRMPFTPQVVTWPPVMQSDPPTGAASSWYSASPGQFPEFPPPGQPQSLAVMPRPFPLTLAGLLPMKEHLPHPRTDYF